MTDRPWVGSRLHLGLVRRVIAMGRWNDVIMLNDEGIGSDGIAFVGCSVVCVICYCKLMRILDMCHSYALEQSRTSFYLSIERVSIRLIIPIKDSTYLSIQSS